MASSLLTCRTGKFSSFASLETPQIYHQQRFRTLNLQLHSQKVYISPAIGSDNRPFPSKRCETVKIKPGSLHVKYRPGRWYGISVVCGVYTFHAAANDKVLTADDMMNQITLYDMLGVSRKAEAKDIKAAYRQQVRRLHPDVAPVDKRKEFTTAFLKIQAAYTTLANPRSRAWYDSQLSLMPFQASAGTDPKHWGVPRATCIHESTKATAAETATTYPWARAAASKWKGRNWETDQCW